MVRLRRDIKFDRLEAFELTDDKEQDILVDEAIRLTGDDTSKQYSRPLRRVVIYRPYDSSRRKKTTEEGATEPTEHTIELVTNNTAWDAETISALYKARWQIESFFKLIKQHLRIKTFIGTNKNAVMCPIRAAMLSMLLLKYLQSRSTQNWHMANLVTFVRIHLMNCVDLRKWQEYTFEASLSPPDFSYE